MPTTSPAPATTESTAITTAAVSLDHLLWGETGLYADQDEGSRWEVILYEPEDIPDADYGMDSPDVNRLVAMLVEIRNTGGASMDTNPLLFRIQDAEGFVYDAAITAQKSKPELKAMTVNPGQEVRGYVVLEIPDAAQVWAGLCDPNFGFPGEQVVWSD